MTGWNMPPGVNESDIPGNRPEDSAWERFLEWAEERGRELAHRANPRCSGGSGVGVGGDGPRYHSKRCDELTDLFVEAQADAARKVLEIGL